FHRSYPVAGADRHFHPRGRSPRGAGPDPRAAVFDAAATRAIGEISWSTNNELLLVAIPLFIMLGEVLLRSGFAERMYGAMSLWLSWLPGGLMHANIGASALFSATSGSSVATAATVGTVAIPQIKKYGYNESLFLGSL